MRWPWTFPYAGVRLVLWIALALIALPAHAQTFPALSGLVVDTASLLPADRKAALETKLQAFQQRTQRQLVVAVIPDLQGYAIEDYGYRLGRSWGVGLKDADNGTILIVAPKDRKVRIEVGRRLEPVLTDALSSVIIRNRILPAFKSGDMAGGIDAGADAIIEQLSRPDEQAKAEAAKAATDFDRQHKRLSASNSIPLGLIFWVFVALFAILAMRRGRAGSKGPWGQQRFRSEGGGNGWVWLWAASEMLNNSHRGSDTGGGGSLWGGGDSGGGSDGSWGGGASGDW